MKKVTKEEWDVDSDYAFGICYFLKRDYGDGLSGLSSMGACSWLAKAKLGE